MSQLYFTLYISSHFSQRLYHNYQSNYFDLTGIGGDKRVSEPMSISPQGHRGSSRSSQGLVSCACDPFSPSDSFFFMLSYSMFNFVDTNNLINYNQPSLFKFNL